MATSSTIEYLSHPKIWFLMTAEDSAASSRPTPHTDTLLSPTGLWHLMPGHLMCEYFLLDVDTFLALLWLWPPLLNCQFAGMSSLLSQFLTPSARPLPLHGFLSRLAPALAHILDYLPLNPVWVPTCHARLSTNIVPTITMLGLWYLL